MKKIKKIYGICQFCSEQLYPERVLHSDRLNGITVSEGKCDICGIKRTKIPVRDFFYAITGNPAYWD
jgi:hypothetical protein